MEFNAIKNKRAQGYTTTELLVFVLVIVTIGLIIWGVISFFGGLQSKAALLPEDVSVLGQICYGIGKSDTKYFCDTFKQVDNQKKKQMVTCQYLKETGIYAGLPEVNCKDYPANVIAKDANATCFNSKLDTTDLLNGKSCADWAVIVSRANNGAVANGAVDCSNATAGGIVTVGTVCSVPANQILNPTIPSPFPSNSVCCK